jgi:hypothetical protein
MTTKCIRNIAEKTKLNEHITLVEAKAQLRLEEDFYDDDTLIEGLISDSRTLAEEYCQIDIAKTENTVKFYNINSQDITFTEIPFIDTISVQYKNDSDVFVDVPIDYTIEKKKSYFKLYFDEVLDYEELVIKFHTGYEVGSCPNSVKRAMLVKISDLYDTERSSYDHNMKNNLTFERLLSGSVIERF